MGKHLSEMTLEELWELFPIFLTEHNDCWNQWFQQEKEALQGLLPPKTRVSHIGSTAIQGIWAKPIVDILLEAPDKATFSQAKAALAGNGYVLMSDSGERVSFNRGYTEQGFAQRVFHLHLRLLGDHDELYFRDYMNTHPEAAKEYEALKLRLWKEYEHDRNEYTRQKTELVRKYTELGKQPEGRSGMEKREETVKAYFRCWVENDPAVLDAVFAEKIVYSECYGPEYRGLGQVKQWFSDWNQKGRVLEWRIKSFLHEENKTAVEWYFRCDYDGEEGGFDGVSLIEFDNAGKIVSLKEFQSKAEHIFPYENGKGSNALRGAKL